MFVSRDDHHAASGCIDAFETELNGHSGFSGTGAGEYGLGNDDYLALFGRHYAWDDDVRKPLDVSECPIYISRMDLDHDACSPLCALPDAWSPRMASA
jgi:hypothetical protein